VALCPLVAPAAAAQTPRAVPAPAAQPRGPLVLAGRALRVSLGGDSVPFAGTYVVGHHVGAQGQGQGPVDSVRSDAAGRFRIVVPRPDTGGVYVVSARYLGIGYFGEPVAPTDRAHAAALTLVVYDTSAQGPALSVLLRHLVLTSPDADGSHRVLDIFQVHNAGTTTRVAADSNGATWRVRLPSGIVDFVLGESDVSPAAVRRVGDTLLVGAPFPPGDKQVLATYALPRGTRELRIPIDQPTLRLDLLVEDSTSSASGAGVQAGPPLEIQGRRFRRFGAERMASGAAVTLRLGAAADTGRRFTWLVVLAAGLGLGAGLFLLLRRRRPATPPARARPAEGADALAAQIAALDERFEGREAETPPDAWAGYAARRAELKERLRTALARDGAV
jgi:hypothetical protein